MSTKQSRWFAWSPTGDTLVAVITELAMIALYGEKPENPTACGGGEWQSGGFGGGSPQGLFP